MPLALRTELNPDDLSKDDLLRYRLTHAALGFTTETAELFCGKDNINELEELGDLSWYLALPTNLLQGMRLPLKLGEGPLRNPWDTSVEVQLQANLGHLVRLAGELADFSKRFTYYRKDPDWSQVQFTVSQAWMAVIKAVKLRDGDFQQVLDANIAKLKSRYPDRFTCKLAVQRNVAKERKVLEQHIGKTE